MFDALNNVCLDVFSEPFVYKGNGAAYVLLQGVFGDQVNQETMAGAGYADRIYVLQLLQTTIDNNGIKLRETVNVRDIDYQIVDLQTDSFGMATLSLRRY